MATIRISSNAALLVATLGVAATALFAPACSSDNSKPETTPIFGSGGSGNDDGGGSGGSSGGGKSSTGGAKSNGGAKSAGGSANVDGGDASASGGATSEPDSGTGGTDAGTCDLPPGDHDCYPCDPVTNDQFLNHCGGTCYPFPNKDRLKDPADPSHDLWNDGKLIDLP
jgi:hypothetical protein